MKIKYFLLFIIANFSMNGQQEIKLQNPSFEGFPRAGTLPDHWDGCGFPNTSPPDTQPGPFSVTLPPQEGLSYIGLIARNDETYEGISQTLSKKLVKGQCYKFSIYLARSPDYWSPTANNPQETNFDSSLKLQIFGGSKYCEPEELLATSPLIFNETWQKFEFIIQPTENWTEIIFEASYDEKSEAAYNGNILLDNASPISVLDCALVKEFLIEKNKKEKEKLKADAAYTAKYMMVENLILKNWDKIVFSKKEKDLTTEAKNHLTNILNSAQKNNLQKILIGIPENDKYFKKKVRALEDFFTPKSFSLGFVRIFPIRINDPHHFWLTKNDSFSIRIK